MSQVTRWPFSVSPLLSSTSIGCPCAAVRRPRGSFAGGVSLGKFKMGRVFVKELGILERGRV